MSVGGPGDPIARTQSRTLFA